MLYEILKGSYCCGSEFNIKQTRKYLGISILKYLSSIAISLIYIMWSRSPITLVSFILDNFVIRVLTRALSNDSNCSSIAFNNCLILLHSVIEQWILAYMRVLMSIILKWLDRSFPPYKTTSTWVLVFAGVGGFPS